ncbi:MAG: secretion protein HlyD [Thermomonas sp.]|uniref:secretion protein HlyD n=1 Tax=Thermomonas sp. TaxID=1971895 RepID=UPI001ED6C02B|nr:secretion protein HlyD [Thermomonas sp.]MBV2208428.1 secretion protein HlyD [Thermomonas sp.]
MNSKHIVIVVAAIVVAVVAWLGIKQAGYSDTALTLYGNVDIREVQLAFRQPGRLLEMSVDEGDVVTTGQPIAKLDDRTFKDALVAADASVRVAQAELSKLQQGLRPQEVAQASEALKQAQALALDAERNFQRQNSLIESGASSQRVVDAAKTLRDQTAAGVKAAQAALSQANEGYRKEDIVAAQARLAAAQASREQAATALADTTLNAPSAGTILARVREPGSMITSQSAVYSLSLNTPVYVRAYVGERDLGRIAPGTRVIVTSDASTKQHLGKIGFISPRAEFTPKTVETTDLRTDLVYRLRIVLDQADASLRQGMPVTIQVVAGE